MNKSIGFWVLIIIALLLLFVDVYQAIHRKYSPAQNLSPIIEQINTENEIIKDLKSQVDYLIKHQPRDGSDGANGLNGYAGRDGKDGQSGLDGKPGKDGKDGINGVNGINGREIQIRCNPLKLQNEWRYVGDIQPYPLDKVIACVPGAEVWQ